MADKNEKDLPASDDIILDSKTDPLNCLSDFYKYKREKRESQIFEEFMDFLKKRDEQFQLEEMEIGAADVDDSNPDDSSSLEKTEKEHEEMQERMKIIRARDDKYELPAWVDTQLLEDLKNPKWVESEALNNPHSAKSPCDIAIAAGEILMAKEGGLMGFQEKIKAEIPKYFKEVGQGGLRNIEIACDMICDNLNYLWSGHSENPFFEREAIEGISKKLERGEQPSTESLVELFCSRHEIEAIRMTMGEFYLSEECTPELRETLEWIHARINDSTSGFDYEVQQKQGELYKAIKEEIKQLPSSLRSAASLKYKYFLYDKKDLLPSDDVLGDRPKGETLREKIERVLDSKNIERVLDNAWWLFPARGFSDEDIANDEEDRIKRALDDKKELPEWVDKQSLQELKNPTWVESEALSNPNSAKNPCNVAIAAGGILMAKEGGLMRLQEQVQAATPEYFLKIGTKGLSYIRGVHEMMIYDFDVLWNGHNRGQGTGIEAIAGMEETEGISKKLERGEQPSAESVYKLFNLRHELDCIQFVLGEFYISEKNSPEFASYVDEVENRMEDFVNSFDVEIENVKEKLYKIIEEEEVEELSPSLRSAAAPGDNAWWLIPARGFSDEEIKKSFFDTFRRAYDLFLSEKFGRKKN